MISPYTARESDQLTLSLGDSVSEINRPTRQDSAMGCLIMVKLDCTHQVVWNSGEFGNLN